MECLSVKQLREKAKIARISGYYKMNKQTLIDHLNNVIGSVRTVRTNAATSPSKRNAGPRLPSPPKNQPTWSLPQPPKHDPSNSFAYWFVSYQLPTGKHYYQSIYVSPELHKVYRKNPWPENFNYTSIMEEYLPEITTLSQKFPIITFVVHARHQNASETLVYIRQGRIQRESNDQIEAS
jgi:hypothetical protein